MDHEGQFCRQPAIENVKFLRPFIGARYLNLVERAVLRHVERQLLPVDCRPVGTMFRLFVELPHGLVGRDEETQCGTLAE